MSHWNLASILKGYDRRFLALYFRLNIHLLLHKTVVQHKMGYELPGKGES